MSAIEHGDCLDVLAGRRAEFEAVATDPPSGISFMGLRFDIDHGGQDKWVEYMAARYSAEREACIQGAYGLYWALPRTQDWTMAALRRAGWHIVDVIQHIHGQGWPKGKGQLKPAQEAWILCRDQRGKVRPLNIDGCRVARSFAERSESWFRSGHSAKPDAAKISGAPPGNGINVDVGGSWPPNAAFSHCPACKEVGVRKVASSNFQGAGPRIHAVYGEDKRARPGVGYASDGTETLPAWSCLACCTCGLASLSPAGGAPARCPGCGEERWWCCPVAELDGQSGETKSGGRSGHVGATLGYGGAVSGFEVSNPIAPSEGGSSRFFPTFHYDAKASARERQAGCEGLLWVKDKAAPIGWRRVSAAEHAAASEKDRAQGNVHATIKPVGAGTDDGFMRWGVRLVTPERGPVLDGMCGSGSTLVAAQIEGLDYFGCDIDPGAVDIARARVAFWTPERHRLELVNAAALRAEEKRQEAAVKRGQQDLFARSA